MRNEINNDIDCMNKAIYIYRIMYGINYESLGNMYAYVGNLYVKVKNNTKAFNYLNISIDILKKDDNKQPLILFYAYINLGKVNYNRKEYKNALENYYIALQLHSKLHENNEIKVLYYGLGSTYFKLKDYDKAISYLHKSINVYRKRHEEFTKVCNKVAKVYYEVKENLQ